MGHAITEQNKRGSIMGSCYSDNHIAKDHIHTDIATCDIEEPQQNYRLGRVSNRLHWGGGEGGYHVLLDPKQLFSISPSCSFMHQHLDMMTMRLTTAASNSGKPSQRAHDIDVISTSCACWDRSNTKEGHPGCTRGLEC